MGMPFFLKKNKEGGASAPAEPIVRKPDDDSDYDMLHAAADDLKQALDEGNTEAIADALRAAFQICDSEPHDEGYHTSED